MAKASTKPPLTDRILARIEASKRLPQGFFHRLPAETQGELLELRRRLHAGELAVPIRTLARGIVEQLKDDGADVCGVQGVTTWLSRRD